MAEQFSTFSQMQSFSWLGAPQNWQLFRLFDQWLWGAWQNEVYVASNIQRNSLVCVTIFVVGGSTCNNLTFNLKWIWENSHEVELSMFWAELFPTLFCTCFTKMSRAVATFCVLVQLAWYHQISGAAWCLMEWRSNQSPYGHDYTENWRSTLTLR